MSRSAHLRGQCTDLSIVQAVAEENGWGFQAEADLTEFQQKYNRSKRMDEEIAAVVSIPGIGSVEITKKGNLVYDGDYSTSRLIEFKKMYAHKAIEKIREKVQAAMTSGRETRNNVAGTLYKLALGRGAVATAPAAGRGAPRGGAA